MAQKNQHQNNNQKAFTDTTRIANNGWSDRKVKVKQH
jgi:hypothetical protein